MPCLLLVPPGDFERATLPLFTLFSNTYRNAIPFEPHPVKELEVKPDTFFLAAADPG
jgi:hypothetical protein